jgi:maleylpyruvate isomerase
VNELEREIAGATRAQAAALVTVRALTDEQVRQPSRLPGWTAGHVATHIARNAEGHVRMLEAAQRGEVAAMYPGGREQRTADIEAGAVRSAREIADDVAATSAALEAAWGRMSESAWAGSGETVAGPVPMRDQPFIRWREVTVHHADLGADFSWKDWDAEYVRLELNRLTMLWASRKPMGMTRLPGAVLAAPAHQRVAWLLGRVEIEGLPPAGIMG